MNEIFEAIYWQITKQISELCAVDRVIGMQEAADLLGIPERTLRSRMNNGEFSEEKGEFRRIAKNIVFDREAIEARRFMKKEIYWELKDASKNELNQGVNVASNTGNSELMKKLELIHTDIKKINNAKGEE